MQLRSRFNKLMKDWFMISIEGKSVYVWHSKRLQEVLLMHVPRFLFLTGSIWTIYCMKVQMAQTSKKKVSVISHRQEAVNSQLRQIEEMLRPDENTFEPGKKVSIDSNYEGDRMKYAYE